MKLFWGVVLLVLSVLIGYILSRKFTKRTEFYRSYKEFNSLVRREVSYSQLSIPQILKTVDYDNDFWTCLKHFYSTKEFVFEKTYVDLQDLELLKNYLMQLGKSDKQTEEKHLDAIEIELEKKLSNAIELEKKYRKLYLKLGVLIGLIALIVCL